MESITTQLLELVDLGATDLGDRELAAVGLGRPVRAPRPSVAQALRASEPGQVIAAQVRGRPVAVAVMEDGRAFAVPDRCPHDGGLLSDGFVEGGRIVCARHGWEIDPCRGTCPQRPRDVIATRELRRR